MTITEFLEARIAEDEAAARDRPASAHIHQSGCYYYDYSLDANWFCDCDEDGKATARVLAECAAKRAIVARAVAAESYRAYDDLEATRHDGEIFALDYVLSALAAVHKDHPDYRQEWAA